jgi:hypothetical protein
MQGCNCRHLDRQRRENLSHRSRLITCQYRMWAGDMIGQEGLGILTVALAQQHCGVKIIRNGLVHGTYSNSTMNPSLPIDKVYQLVHRFVGLSKEFFVVLQQGHARSRLVASKNLTDESETEALVAVIAKPELTVADWHCLSFPPFDSSTAWASRETCSRT